MYAKVFKSLWYGSMYGQTDVQHVFIFLLAHCDPEGFVEMVAEAIAAPTGLTPERVRVALEALCQDDPASRSPEQGGRRLEPIDERGWGWKIVNYQYYRGLRDADERRKQTREAVRRHRQAKVSRGKPVEAHGEVEADADAENQHTRPLAALAERDPAGFADFYGRYPRRIGRRAAAKAFASAVKRHPGLELVDFSNAAGWYARGVKEKGTEDRFIPHPSTWLNQDRFLEEYADEEPEVSGNGAAEAQAARKLPQ